MQSSFTPGTHLKVRFGLYCHHGIASGTGKVVHFGRGIFDIENAEIELVDLATFSRNNPIEAVESKLEFDIAQVETRALSRVGEKGYDLWNNNCEHFVAWCRSGICESQQIDLVELVARQTAAICAKPLLHKLVSKTVAGASARILGRSSVAASVADAVQATAEVTATKMGKQKSEVRRIGRQAGFASSAAFGWLAGGPSTAVTGTSLWIFCQLVARQGTKSATNTDLCNSN